MFNWRLFNLDWFARINLPKGYVQHLHVTPNTLWCHRRESFTRQSRQMVRVIISSNKCRCQGHEICIEIEWPCLVLPSVRRWKIGKCKWQVRETKGKREAYLERDLIERTGRGGGGGRSSGRCGRVTSSSPSLSLILRFGLTWISSVLAALICLSLSLRSLVTHRQRETSWRWGHTESSRASIKDSIDFPPFPVAVGGLIWKKNGRQKWISWVSRVIFSIHSKNYF